LGWDAVDAAASGANAVQGGSFGLVSDKRRDRRTALMRTVKPCGLAPVAGVKLAEQVGPTGRGHAIHPPMTVARRIRRRGERGVNR